MKEKTLRRIEQDIVSGDYGKARDRLHGLLGSYPHDLSLRRMLGDIYWHLQYPVMAGRYWYLEEEKTPAMSVACAAFERSCGSDPVQILFGQSGRDRYQYSRQFKVRGKVLLLGLLVALAAALGLMVVGLATVLQWLF
jgi:hypothetical protein